MKYNKKQMEEIVDEMIILRLKYIEEAVHSCKQVKQGRNICDTCIRLGFLKFTEKVLDILINNYRFDNDDIDNFHIMMKAKGDKIQERHRKEIRQMKTEITRKNQMREISKIEEIEQLFNQTYNKN